MALSDNWWTVIIILIVVILVLLMNTGNFATCATLAYNADDEEESYAML